MHVQVKIVCLLLESIVPDPLTHQQMSQVSLDIADVWHMIQSTTHLHKLLGVWFMIQSTTDPHKVTMLKAA